jgi:CheY-like chemotaxis protein/anti-sigma regulatory factor (Ser/Thr protein kinase)
LVSKNDNQFISNFPDDLGTMRADVTKVRQVLLNLLSNAAKFTKEGTVTLSVRRELRQDTDWILMSVIDGGIGISADKISKVFEAFSQADDSTTRIYGGSGLGLPISRRFCQMMGGDITVSSEVGHGSTFTIELPAEVKETIADPVPAVNEAEDVGRVLEEGDLILVIDDDPNALEIIKRTLELDGYSVVTAANGEEGLDLARRAEPALITCDIMMPGMDGWAFLRKLKADPDLQHIPVVMVSIVADKELGYSLGAVESLTKPVDRKKLLDTVQKFAGSKGGGHVLVVEDDEDIRLLIGRTLREENWLVSEAENGAVALERVIEQKPDLILLDLMMPVMDGFEFVQKLREDENNRWIPIIVVTAMDLTEEDRRQLASGVEHIIDKGAFTQEDMLQQIRDLAIKKSED